ncbi:MAG: glycosyltransferase family 4 protein [Bryobacterales bacterium]|nr:glycosyltransferase family 4 protein [Bryobacterales bacterium]MBV9397619.1 glycosyltransferase family 4 protein [Bryobacterales bacterium]
MKVGSFAPLPPARTGVADYAATLLSALSRYGETTANAHDADVALYHIGNNQLHREIYARAVSRPGVVVLHDAVLHHFFLGTLSRAAYIEEFVYNYGEWNRSLAETLWATRARSAADPRYFEYPMLKRLVCASRAVIVHNPAAARIVRAHNPQARVIEIPHFFESPVLPDPVDRVRFRDRLGLRPRTLLVGVFGHLRETKRLPVLLRAMQRVWAAGIDAVLLVQGDFTSRDLKRSLAPQLDRHPTILRAGFLNAGDFWKWAAATDVCVNLRFPTAAETSGIAISMMGIRKTVVFSEGEEIARIPENACLRVDRRPGEEDTLAEYLRWLAGDREAALEIGSRAAVHISGEHALDKVASRYWQVLASSY